MEEEHNYDSNNYRGRGRYRGGGRGRGRNNYSENGGGRGRGRGRGEWEQYEPQVRGRGGRGGRGRGRGYYDNEQSGSWQDISDGAYRPPGSRGRRGGRARGEPARGGRYGGPQGNNDFFSRASAPHQVDEELTPSTLATIPAETQSSAAGGTQLTITIEGQLAVDVYECAICCSTVRRRDWTWSCERCYKLLHLNCVKEWAKGSSFRCPGCQLEYTAAPTRYVCFCGGTPNPRDNSYYTPHSCGDPCKRSRACIHPCPLRCHPGPCPPCELATAIVCHCGKRQSSMGCTQLLQEGIPSCGEVCGKMLNCGKHTCEDMCHPGECSGCNAKQEVHCYCGFATKKVDCIVADDKWCCAKVCEKPLDCGNHTCMKKCHDEECGKCPLRPEVVTTCPCGKTKLFLLTPTIRKKCTDPIMICDKVCGKKLECGHSCPSDCHEGECPPCTSMRTVHCGCKALNTKMPCQAYKELRTIVPAYMDETTITYEDKEYTYPVVCTRPCGTPKSCGRHKCSDKCCPNKNNSLAEDHKCTLPCGRKLPCGHQCDNNCHKGLCPPCANIITDELRCDCGVQVIQPPQPCGTKPPTCNLPCRRERDCGHPNVPHTCHPGECPKCSIFVEKPCLGDHVTVANVPCHLPGKSCGTPCEKPLSCEKHACQRTCHAGPCLKDSQCTQQCAKILSCGHSCKQKCHNGKCQNCKEIVEVKCKCGHYTEKMTCAKFEKAFNEMLKKGGCAADVTVECVKECAGSQRLAGLASALGIGSKSGGSNEGHPFQSQTQWSATTINVCKSRLVDVKQFERQLDDFLASGKTELSFPSMQKERRAVLHEMVPYYGFASTSYDREPNRNVIIVRGAGTRKPCPLLSQALVDPNYDALRDAKDRLDKYPGCGVYVEGLTKDVRESHLVQYTKGYCGLFTLIWVDDCSCIAAYATASMAADALEQMKQNGIPYPCKLYTNVLYPARDGVQQDTRQKRSPPVQPKTVDGWGVQSGKGAAARNLISGPEPLSVSNTWASLGNRK